MLKVQSEISTMQILIYVVCDVRVEETWVLLILVRLHPRALSLQSEI